MSEYNLVKLLDTAKTNLEYGSGASAVEYNGKTRYIRITDINECGELSKDKVSPSEFNEKYLLNKGDILFARSGATVGKTYIHANNDEECIFAGYLIRYIPDIEIVFPKYVYYFTKSDKYANFISLTQRAVAQPNINAKQYSQILIPLYSMEDQMHIADVLDKTQEIIDGHKKQLEELDNLIKAVFYEMFGDPIKNPKNWNYINLENIGEMSSGGTPSRSNRDYFNGRIDWFTAGELNSLYLNESIEKITEKAIKESSTKLFSKDSLLIGMYDTAAFKMGILKKDSCANQACANICLYKNSDVDIVWLYYNLNLMREYFLSNRRGIRQKNLNLGMIKKFEIPVPPCDIQNKFAEIVTKIEAQKAVVKQAITESQNLFNSLMSEYFE